MPAAPATPPLAAPAGPRRVDPTTGWPLFDTAAARRHEAAALALHPAGTLMARAGLALARLAVARFPGCRRVTVFAGPGHNGGDGFVVARCLHAIGWQVECREIAPRPAGPPGDAAAARAAALAAGVPFVPATAPLQADLLVDAMLGLGAKRAPSAPIADAIERLRRHGAPVLAVDLPSGLDPDTGRVLGDVAVVATVTLALMALKPGLFTAQGRDHVGEVWFDALDALAPEHVGVAPTAWLAGAATTPPRPHDSHKGRYGDVVVVGGAAGMAGAAWLAAGAALAAGAGRVYAGLLDDGTSLSPRPELMLLAKAWTAPPATLAARTVVAGCGGGTAVRAALPPLLAHAGRLVLDADALNAVAADPMLAERLAARGRRRPAATVLTPHPTEAARLLTTTTPAVQADRLAAAQALAERFGAVVLLKGSGSIVAAPGSVPRVVPTGNAALASPGTGDVLAGWLGGCWSAAPARATAEIATDAAWSHGAAADRHAQQHPGRPLRAAELVELLAHG